jgi:hypothetical protein
VSLKRFVAPAGVELSGTCERPPPSDRPPQRSFFNVTVAPTSRKVLPQSPVAVVERKSKSRVVLVVLAGAIVEVELEVDELVDDDVDELVLDDVVELVDEVVANVLVEELVLDDVDELDELVEEDVELEVVLDVLDVVGMDELVDVVDDVLVDDVLVDEDVELDVLLVEVDDDVDDDVDEEVEDDVLVELEVLELDVVLVVVVFVTRKSSSSTQVSTRLFRMDELPVGGPQSFPLLFSSL